MLVGQDPASDEAGAVEQARRWAQETGVDVVVKTGHLAAKIASNTWVRPDGSQHTAKAEWVNSWNTHGTGCSLSSALATRLGWGEDPATALGWVTDWLHESISHGAALHVGQGHGPIDHGYRARERGAHL